MTVLLPLVAALPSCSRHVERPFSELERMSRVNERARAADRDPAFSQRIREGLPLPAPVR